MPRTTDLLQVKLVAHTLLDVQIQETALSPVIVSHPFTNSGISALRNEDGSLSMVDLINNLDDCTRWRRKVGEQIDSAENVHQIFVLLNPPYYLTFIKFTASALSEQDLGQLLCTAWTQGECPNQDCNVSKRELVAMFRSVPPESLMDEEERAAHQALEDTVTVYRGVTHYNAKNIRALSWTLDRKTADWFAHRFGEEGTVYEAQIRKEHIVMKTGTHPMRTRLRLFLDWGIKFGAPYTVPERANRTVDYANRVDLERNLPKADKAEEAAEHHAYAVSGYGGMSHDPVQEKAKKYGKSIKSMEGENT